VEPIGIEPMTSSLQS